MQKSIYNWIDFFKKVLVYFFKHISFFMILYLEFQVLNFRKLHTVPYCILVLFYVLNFKIGHKTFIKSKSN